MADEIVDVDCKGKIVQVLKDGETYNVLVDGISKHGTCTADDVIRVMAFYLHDDSCKDDPRRA